MTRTKLLTAAVVLSSLVGYLEWGQGRSIFLYQAELEIATAAWRDPAGLLHPFIAVPMLGQFALLVTLGQASPSRWLAYAGIAGIGLLLGFMFVIGIISVNPRIIAGSLPFVVLASIMIRHLRT